MYRCAVIDDEALARERIRVLLGSRVNWQVEFESSEVGESKRLLMQHQPDICFMDIELIGGSGFQLVQELRSILDTKWVFISAYSQFAVDAFALEACDYLLKPFEDGRFYQLLNKIESAPNNKYKPKNLIAIKSVGHVHFVRPQEIIWIKGAGNYLELHCQHRTYLHREPLSSLLNTLDPNQFVRVHRCAAINIDYVAGLNSELGRLCSLELSNGDEVRISASHKNQLFDRLGVDPLV